MVLSLEELDRQDIFVLTPQAGDPMDEFYGKLAGVESLTAALLADWADERERE